MGERTSTQSVGGQAGRPGGGFGVSGRPSCAPETRPEITGSAPPAGGVWSDHTRGITSDLEDAEGLEAVASDGWELVHVIVPFAQTRHLDISYPGNTRKLIAYYRRPRGLEET